jgi:hypothetical protein
MMAMFLMWSDMMELSVEVRCSTALVCVQFGDAEEL